MMKYGDEIRKEKHSTSSNEKQMNNKISLGGKSMNDSTVVMIGIY